MKKMKNVLAGLLFALLCCSSQAMAIDVYGFASYWEKGDVDGTWGTGLGVSLPLLTEHLRLDGRAHYFQESDLESDKLKVTPFDFGAQVHILPSSKFDPYLLAGVSYVYVDTEHINLDSNLGGYFGAGLDLELGTSLFKLFGELIYRFNDIDNVDSGDDIDVSGFTGNVGLKFHF